MSYDKVEAKSEFTRWSASYDKCILQWLLFEPSHRAMIGKIGGKSAGRPIRLLDVGCGTGVFGARMRRELPGATVYGVDLVSGMLAQGADRWRADAEGLLPVQGDSERLPFATGSFDVLTCANSFHHYPNQRGAVAEMFRVLKPGGRLLLIDGYRDAPWGWFIFDVCVAGVEGAVHHASRAELRGYFAAAGFAEVEQKVHRGPAPFVMTVGVRPLATPMMPHGRVAAAQPARIARAQVASAGSRGGSGSDS